MSIALKSLLALGLLTIVTACAQQEEPVEEVPMVMEEPTMDKM